MAATSLILPAITGVGYVADNPDIEASIRRRGMTCIGEVDMLRAFEIAMTPSNELPEDVDHFIAGLQPQQLAASVKAASSEVTWTASPRLRTLVAAMKDHSSPKSHSTQQSIMTLIQSGASDEDILDAIEASVVERLSRLLMLPVDEIQGSKKSLANFGLDSMIGAEFRSWIFSEFKVDMPFQQLLDGNLGIPQLAVKVLEKARVNAQ